MKGEFEFISGIRGSFPSPEGIVGIGDDCAIIPQNAGFETIVSTDMLVEGIHFLMEDIPPYALGWKSAASSFSDIAAMGGTPLGCFLAIALPRQIQEGWAEEFLHGLRDLSSLYGFSLLGGDTVSSNGGVSVCITVLGQSPRGGSIRRSGARPGDLLCVTGSLGDSAAGLDAILRRLPRTGEVQHLVDRHYLPHPRIAQGQKLAACGGVHSMMDISDGIASDVRHIMKESGVGVKIDVNSVPVSEELRAYCARYGGDILHFSICGGEDYELLFTVDPSLEPLLSVEHYVIGKVTDSGILQWKGTDRDYTGFKHF